MKRLLLFVYLLAGLLLASNYNITQRTLNRQAPLHDLDQVQNMSAGTDVDGKVDIEITRDNTEVTIKHLSKYKIDYVVVEYAYMEDDSVLSARLTQIPVKNNKFIVQSNWSAIKVHQIKTLIGNVYYTYSTTDNKLNTAPSNFNWSSVRRLNTVELEQVALRKVDVEGKYVFKGQMYEVYFKFDTPHDELKAITLEYIKVKHNPPFKDKKTNESERLIWQFKTNDKWELGSEMERLVANTDTTIDANYIGRFFPHISNSLPYYSVENVLIIEIEYVIDGEFIIADVVTDPISPADDAIAWLIKFVETLKNLWSTITNFFTGNANTILKVVVAIIILILIKPVIALIKLIASLIKLVINGIKTLFTTIINSLKWLFIPSKKKNNRRRN